MSSSRIIEIHTTDGVVGVPSEGGRVSLATVRALCPNATTLKYTREDGITVALIVHGESLILPDDEDWGRAYSPVTSHVTPQGGLALGKFQKEKES